jgi:ubiquinone/menaquinone biosynthesis C-methylase UbiE
MSGDSAAFSGDIPHHYDAGLGPVIFFGYAADIARRAAELQRLRVLETAAGTGIVTRILRDVLPATTQLTCTDLQASMLEVARRKFRADEPVDFHSADATALPFSDGGFDLVVCQFGVMFYPDKDRAYREVRRVLAGGGHYLFSVWDQHRYNGFGRITHDAIARFFPDDPPQFMKIPFSYRFDAITESLIAAGFSDISTSVVQLRRELPDLDSFARGLVYGSPLIDQVGARGGVDAEEIRAAIVRDLEQEFGNPGIMPIQALVFSATKT